MESAQQHALRLLEPSSNIPVVTRDQVRRAKPNPDLFFAAAERLEVDIHESFVVGDGVWELLGALEQEREESAFCRAVMGMMNCSALACTVFIRTRLISCSTRACSAYAVLPDSDRYRA
jgi:hypothetical protein